jgi:hypothetical protein
VTPLLTVRDVSAGVKVYDVRDVVFTSYKLTDLFTDRWAVRSVINIGQVRERNKMDHCKVCGNKVRQFLETREEEEEEDDDDDDDEEVEE